MKFRRKKSDEATQADQQVEPTAEQPGAETGAEATEDAVGNLRADGPWDVTEVDEEETQRIDLGSLLVAPHESLEVQLQVDEQSGQVIAVVLAAEEGAVELRAFAAPRHGDIWDDVRTQIAAEVSRRGGTATEAVGPWGPELRVVLNVTTPDGRTGTQPSRVFGIPGPRWMLRATFFGKPALEPSDDGLVERALRDVVVRRGTQPLAPGEPLPLTVPPEMLED